MQSHRSFKVNLFLPQVYCQDWRKQLTILNNTEHMTNVARYIYHSLNLRTQPQLNKILRLNLWCFLFLLVFYYLQTPCPMSTCLFSYIHAVFNLQTLPSTFLCQFGMYSIAKYMPRMNTGRIFVTFPQNL